jgi:tagatose 6-phosphate kinase
VSPSAGALPGPDLLAVGVNPAVDVYYRLERFCPGDVNRMTPVRTAAGGKANNLARAYRRLGGRPMTTGIAGGVNGQRLLSGLTEEGIDHDYVAGDGETRQTITLVAGGSTTVLLEPGPRVAEGELDALAGKVAARAATVPTVAFTGSLPPGAPAPYLARLVQRVRQVSPAFVALDASGEALRLAGLAGPHLIKVNAEEFERAFAQPARSRAGLEHRFQTLAEGGVETLCLTDGARGALLLTGGGGFVVRTETGPPLSTAGAGDAFLAGLLVGLGRGDGPREAARLASAAAAAALETIGAGFIEPAAVAAALTRTRLLDAAVFFAER